MTNKVEDFYSLALTLIVLHICLIAVSEKYIYAQSQHVVDPQASQSSHIDSCVLAFSMELQPQLCSVDEGGKVKSVHSIADGQMWPLDISL